MATSMGKDGGVFKLDIDIISSKFQLKNLYLSTKEKVFFEGKLHCHDHEYNISIFKSNVRFTEIITT